MKKAGKTKRVTDNNRIFAANIQERGYIVMEDLLLSIPKQDAAFFETLVSRMGWTMRKRRTSVERFINSCQKTPLMTDEEIQAEVNAVRYGG